MSTNQFPITSRYYGVKVATLTVPDGENPEGRQIAYLRRRFVPPPDNFQLLQEYTVVGGDRLDNIAAKFLGDPEQFWRICDANGAIRPEELTETIGGKLRITLPENIPGPSNA